MILDKGFCSIYATANVAAPGDMPKEEGLVLKYQSWYGELGFETSPRNVAAHEGVVVANRIRVLQNRDITNHDVAVLSSVLPPPPDTPRYNIVRVYHGFDEDNGQPISDVTLERIAEE